MSHLGERLNTIINWGPGVPSIERFCCVPVVPLLRMVTSGYAPLPMRPPTSTELSVSIVW